MNVLMANTVDLDKNGISTCILNYAYALKKKGINVFITASNSLDKHLEKELQQLGIIYIQLPPRKKKTLFYMYELKKVLKKNHIDILHAHGNSATIIFEMIAGILSGCKVRIAHSHNSMCEHKYIDKMLRPLFYKAYTVGCACGDKAGKWLFKNRGYTIINNGIDFKKYKVSESIKEKIRIDMGVEDRVVLGHIGEFSDIKNQIYLVELMKKLKKINSKFLLILIGKGYRENFIREKVKEEDLEENVYFAGVTDDIPKFLSIFDVFLLPSLYEGLPFVLVEAQAASVPCIVSNTVSRESELSNLIHFVSLEQPEVWIEKIEKIIKKKDIVVDTKRLNKKYNIDKCVDDLMDIYQKSLKSKNI